MTAPRGLTAEEQAIWEKVAATIKPLDPRRSTDLGYPEDSAGAPLAPPKPFVPSKPKGRVPPMRPPAPPPPPAPRPLDGQHGLDRSWERKLARTGTDPDFTLDLHGHTLDAAYERLDRGIRQAMAMDARLVLVITGKPRPVDAADRGTSRGAIRAKILDWLAAGPHGGDIAAVRKAHRRHGGEGALYLVLKRQR